MNQLEIDFEGLYVRYEKMLKGIVRSIIHDPFLTEDIVQDTFVKAYQKLETLTHSDRAGAWLSMIARRTAIDYLRKEKKNEAYLIENFYEYTASPQPSIDQIVDNAELIEKMYDCVNEWDDARRQVFLLKAFHGMKDEDISNQLHIKLGTVKTWIHRSRRLLKTELVNHQRQLA
ncbi:RNA polymerase sigma factor [Peribacillus alkalitolerans]|uniref:RNA polymerase sigma factor n=1 Tax=Peribacillus alkalitolerans TaxID=1550385 RepID=UPI0013D43A0D|nr:RNA polymerase sigma factor [Peribacillus alkalitolerans]